MILSGISTIPTELIPLRRRRSHSLRPEFFGIARREIRYSRKTGSVPQYDLLQLDLGFSPSGHKIKAGCLVTVLATGEARKHKLTDLSTTLA